MEASDATESDADDSPAEKHKLDDDDDQDLNVNADEQVEIENSVQHGGLRFDKDDVIKKCYLGVIENCARIN